MTHDSPLKRAYRLALNVSAKAIGSDLTRVLDARVRFGRRLELRHPATLADKVCWLETHTSLETLARCTDKFEVRAYVAELGLADILVPLVGGPWTHAAEIDFEQLPTQFALKATHSCGMNIICSDRDALDLPRTRRIVDEWLSKDYSRACIEPHYKLIPHRAYCEEYLEDACDIIDYKIHCLNGEPAFILTCSERDTGLKLNLYDTSWQPIDELVQMRNGRDVPRPEGLDRMIGIARALSAPFSFVRVDLYEVSGVIRFGELTFTPAAGVFPYFSKEFLEAQGKVLRLDG